MTTDARADQLESALNEADRSTVSILSGDEPLDLSDLLNTVLDRGAVVHGEVTIAVADVDLIKLNLGLLLQAVATAERRALTRDGAASSESLSGALGAIPRSREGLGGPDRAAFGPVSNRESVHGPGTLSASETVNSAGSVPIGPGDGYSTDDPGTAGTAGTADRSLNAVARGLPERINADGAGPETGLARLVLTLIEVLRKVLEHQAVRRMEGGRLSGEEIERLGLALAKLNDRMGELKHVFGLSEDDLNIDLGPLGRLK